MATTRLTPDEERLLERYVSVLDFVGRCAQAVDEEHWHYLWDKTGQLLRAVESLKQELDRTSGWPKVRREVLAAAVRHHARHYRAGRLLHPAQVDLTAGEVGSILLAVAGGDALLADEAALEKIRAAAEAIAERTGLPPVTAARVLCALSSWEVRS
jgi:hypothetical protein